MSRHPFPDTPTYPVAGTPEYRVSGTPSLLLTYTPDFREAATGLRAIGHGKPVHKWNRADGWHYAEAVGWGSVNRQRPGCLQTLAAKTDTNCATTTTTVGGKIVEYPWTVVGDTVTMSRNGRGLTGR